MAIIKPNNAPFLSIENLDALYLSEKLLKDDFILVLGGTNNASSAKFDLSSIKRAAKKLIM